MYCLLNKCHLSFLKPVTTFSFFLIWAASYVFFFFFFSPIADYTVELNPEGEWMEKMQGLNGFMSDSVCWIKQICKGVIFPIISVSSYCPWFDAMKVWIFEKIESKWGLDIRRQLLMGKIESSKDISWIIKHFLICNIGILQSIKCHVHWDWKWKTQLYVRSLLYF